MTDHRLEAITLDQRSNMHTAHCKCGWSGAALGLSAVITAHRNHFIALTEGSTPMTKFPIGAHVVYRGKSYAFPGEVTMRDDTGVVVKAFGDMDGNYAGMKHIYADSVLEPYELGGPTDGNIPPLVIFPDDNAIAKMRQWVALHAHKPGAPRLGLYTIRKLLEELEALGAKQDAWEEREALQARLDKQNALVRTCTECGGSGWKGHGQGGDTCGRCGGRGTIGYVTPKPGAVEKQLCKHTGLPCLPGCTQQECAGFYTPLDKWPGVTDD